MSIAEHRTRPPSDETCSLERAGAEAEPLDIEASRPPVRLLWAVLAVLCLIAQLNGLYAPEGGGPAPFPHADKVFHAAAFAAVTATAMLAGVRTRWVLAINAVHAVVSEIVQGVFLESRSGDPLDVLADGIGIALGWLTAAGIMRLSTALRRPRA
ncbi:VanZ family protein [Brevibacterium album]|uniref:VanZ family protein n=1 Tax=Brevibacterium album TaxID=417948 RepID=UPI00040B78ED|nr:VanZ family protein [Brevibacterium album]